MTTKASYTPEEWQLLYKVAPMAGLVVTLASPNGPFGVMKEMFAVGMAIAETFQKGTDNELIKSLVDDMKARGTKPERPTGIDTPEKVKAAAMDTLKGVKELLASKSTPEEAAGFKTWINSIATKVAEASNEGGILGFGGVKVSEAERTALQEISQALA
jgi:hypothetical protein